MVEIMERKAKICISLSVCFLLTFIIWTFLLCLVDISPIGPNGSSVGFAKVNGSFHSFTGIHMYLYTITDWLSIVPLGFVAGFGIIGVGQLLKRKKILLVDRSIIVLGVFYIAVMAIFLLFEEVVINYRPVLIEGVLEASYPSSTTMLVMCVMPTTLMQLNTRIKNRIVRYIVLTLIILFTAFMVISRLVSGVHWFTDIIGGALLSAGLVLLYYYFCEYKLK